MVMTPEQRQTRIEEATPDVPREIARQCLVDLLKKENMPCG